MCPSVADPSIPTKDIHAIEICLSIYMVLQKRECPGQPRPLKDYLEDYWRHHEGDVLSIDRLAPSCVKEMIAQAYFNCRFFPIVDKMTT